MDIEKLKKKALKFEKSFESHYEGSKKNYNEFISLYPFKEHPIQIDNLKPEDIYNPGNPPYFLYYVEHKLKDFGNIGIGQAAFAENASQQIDEFKSLLKIVVDDSISISDKIDANWHKISQWGGDKQKAKKIVFLYNPSKVLPIYKTEHLEYFAAMINPNFKKDYSKSDNYDKATPGNKFEYLNDILLKFKNQVFKDEIDNTLFMHILYEFYPPPGTKKHDVWLFTVDMKKNPDFKSRSEDVWNSAKEVKEGDIILFYCAAPHSHIGDIYIAMSNSYEDDKMRKNWNSPAVNISKIVEISNPLEYNELVNNPNLEKWHAIKMNFGKSHFKVYNNQWTELKRMIFDKNPELKETISDLEDSVLTLSNTPLTKDKPQKDFLDLLNEIYTTEIEIALGELKRGKNIIFYGPPGSGKTVLSKIISEKYIEKDGYSLYTVHSGTDYYDLVCRIVPQIDDQGNLVYSKERRFLLDALLSGKVLILDEINRTQIDTALGIFFTYLERDHRINDVKQIQNILKNELDEEFESDELKHKLEDFRIIGTLNVYDKTFLFKLGDALKRRFTFIEITTKTELARDLTANPNFKDEFTKICGYEKDQSVADLIINVFVDLNYTKPLGIGILKEALQFSQYFPKNEATDISISSLIVPFFENDLNYSTIRNILEKYGLKNSIKKLESLNFGASDVNGFR